MKTVSVFIVIIIAAIGCNTQSTEPLKDTFTVKGTLINSNGAVANATVSIDSALNWTTKSDQNGNFTITSVSKGSHSITFTKSYGDSTFVIKSNTLQVSDDITLQALTLPIPTNMYQPVTIDNFSVQLTWTQTDAEDFREYKLYRRDTPGLDETTGELVYVGTNRMDTSFSEINLASGKTYYYRVYIMNDFGKLGGSNIVSTTTLKGNIVTDGDFENRQDIFTFWGINYGSANFIFSDSVKKSGNYSLQGKLSSIDVKLHSTGVFKLAGGVTYEISGWFKANGTTSGTREWLAFGFTDGPNYNYGQQISVWVQSGVLLSEPVNIDWTYVTKTFIPPTDVTVYLYLYSGIENFWFDDLRLIAK